MAQSDVYLWEAPGKPISISISLDVVDRLLQDAMGGFGAVPRRGAEVGGFLIGRIAPDQKPTVAIEDYQLIPIEYRRGPSFLLSDADQQSFEEAFAKLSRRGEDATLHPIGFFRTNTREANELGPEDLELLDRFFPGPDGIVLLIRPYATRVSTAGFYFRENGSFQDGPPLQPFNFRRKDLGGGTPFDGGRPPRRTDVKAGTAEAGQAEEAGPTRGRGEGRYARSQHPVAPVVEAAPLPAMIKTKPRGGWLWLPISFTFLLLGVLLGFQAAVALGLRTSGGDPFTVALTVTREADSLNVRWDRQAPAIRNAKQGVLIIEDGPTSRSVYLTAEQLQTGSVVYPHKRGSVKFRLELVLKTSDTMIEKMEWKE